MSIPVCKFYSTNRKCAFDKHCRFLHCESPGPPIKPDYLKSKNHEEHLENPAYPLTTRTISEKHTRLNNLQNEGELGVKSVNIISQSRQHQDYTDNSQDEHSVQLENKKSVKTVCFYFKTYGNCRYGRDCKFSHIIFDSQQGYKHDESNKQQRSAGQRVEIPPRFRKTEEQKEERVQSNVGKDLRPRNTRNHSGRQIKVNLTNEATLSSYTYTERRVCRFFKRGYCSKGDYCQFVHPNDGSSELKSATSNSSKPEYEKIQNDSREDTNPETKFSNEMGENNTKAFSRHAYRPNNRSFARPLPMKQSFTYAELENIDIKKVRDSEINTIKKRFPRDKITILEETENKFSSKIVFSPTDPDWAFDVRVFELLITIPSNYPREMMNVVLPVDQDIPETIRRYVEVSIKEWLDQKVDQLATKSKVELMFRPFLLWLDRNIEDITMEALKQWKRELVAKAAGMEFIPAAKLQEKFKVQSEACSDEEDKEHSESSDESEVTSDESEDSSDNSEDDLDDKEIVLTHDINPEKKGTEIELRHLQLLENASALMFEKLQLVLQCGRCKNHSDMLVPPGKVMSIQCEKCSQKQFVHFRAALIHQFSSVVGYLDLDGCQAFDLIFQNCCVAVTCMGCSKQTRINGFVSGHVVDGWCQACNARFKLATEAVKFSQLVPSSIDTSAHKLVEVASSKQKKPPKDPAIREGCPLPEFGTCKHYKHSYRWLRFPCCGKAYPCDICHDKKEDHEMVYATRMICGHCCREQNFSATRPCSSCNHHLTKIRTAHWEGGSGCRDKISMSKNDNQKYKNINKTLSNHKKKVKTGTLKKITKLRHV